MSLNLLISVIFVDVSCVLPDQNWKTGHRISGEVHVGQSTTTLQVGR